MGPCMGDMPCPSPSTYLSSARFASPCSRGASGTSSANGFYDRVSRLMGNLRTCPPPDEGPLRIGPRALAAATFACLTTAGHRRGRSHREFRALREIRARPGSGRRRQGFQHLLGARLVPAADEGQESLSDTAFGENGQFETSADILEEHRPHRSPRNRSGPSPGKWTVAATPRPGELPAIQRAGKPQAPGPDARLGMRGMQHGSPAPDFFLLRPDQGRQNLRVKNQRRVQIP